MSAPRGPSLACYSPLRAYRAVQGGVTFDKHQAFVDRPVELACGQCIGCRADRQRDWAVRCLHEEQLHRNSGGSSFLTLTYDDRHVPRDKFGLWDMSLRKRHWQTFAKRLRKKVGPFRYLHCGEYGTENKRPHYHACIFGLDFADDSVPLAGARDDLRVSATIAETWPYGFHTLGAVTFSSAHYVAKYCTKRLTGKKIADEQLYSRVCAETGEAYQVEPEYSTMSRRPGLGYEWFKRYYRDIYPNDFCIVNGREVKPPAYYDDLLEREDPELFQRVKHQRRRKLKGEKWNHTPERLAVRERIKERRVMDGSACRI